MSLEAMKAVLDHSKATTERMTLFMIAYRMSPDEGYASAAISRLARDSGVTTDTIHRHLYHLQQRSELIVVERPGKTSLYRVTLPGAVDDEVLRNHPTPLQNNPPLKSTPLQNDTPTPPQNAARPPRKITPQKEVKENENTLAAHDQKSRSAVLAKITFDFDTAKFGPHELMAQRVELWREAYPAVNVMQEIKQAAAWLIANPKNRKSNYEKFLTNWFSRAQDKAPRATQGKSTVVPGGWI